MGGEDVGVGDGDGVLGGGGGEEGGGEHGGGEGEEVEGYEEELVEGADCEEDVLSSHKACVSISLLSVRIPGCDAGAIDR